MVSLVASGRQAPLTPWGSGSAVVWRRPSARAVPPVRLRERRGRGLSALTELPAPSHIR